MAYRIKAKIIKDSDTYYYFMGFTKQGKLPQWDAEYSSLPKREYTTKSVVSRMVNKIKATHLFPLEIEVEEVINN